MAIKHKLNEEEEEEEKKEKETSSSHLSSSGSRACFIVPISLFLSG